MAGWVGGIGNKAQLRPAKLELGVGLSLAKRCCSLSWCCWAELQNKLSWVGGWMGGWLEIGESGNKAKLDQLSCSLSWSWAQLDNITTIRKYLLAGVENNMTFSELGNMIHQATFTNKIQGLLLVRLSSILAHRPQTCLRLHDQTYI